MDTSPSHTAVSPSFPTSSVDDSALYLVVNPAAGHGRARREWPAIARALKEARLPFEVTFTERTGDATRLAAEALEAGAATVVAVGGDGTANEVANGFVRPPDGDQDGAPALRNTAARFGFIPVGTGVDLARTLELRDGKRAVAALGPSGRTNYLDLGRARFRDHAGQPAERFFLVGSDLGLGGETVATILATGDRAKALGSVVTYLAGVIVAILRHQPGRVRYVIDDQPWVETETDIIFVANSPYIAGGMIVAPGASLQDGELDLILLRRVSKLALLFRLLPAIYRGAHLKHPAVRHARIHRLRVEADSRLLLQLDGEQPGLAPAEFSVVPRFLPVRAP